MSFLWVYDCKSRTGTTRVSTYRSMIDLLRHKTFACNDLCNHHYTNKNEDKGSIQIDYIRRNIMIVFLQKARDG